MDELKGEYRNTVQELKYYGSDYNKFLHIECTKEMTVNNIDCIQYKRSKKILRIVESKHINEGGKNTQSELLNIIANIFRFINCMSNGISKIFNVDFPLKKCECYKVFAQYPFENAIIYDYIKKKEYKISNKYDLIKWSGFELDFE